MLVDLKDAVLRLIQKYIRDNVNTILPGKVVSINNYGSKQTVDVVVRIARLYTDGDIHPNGDAVIYGVPVVMPSAGGGMLSFPIQVGDTVLLVFGQRNIESWLLSSGQDESIPEDSRHYSQSDAIAIPGLYTTLSHLKPSTTNVELKFKNSTIHITPDNTIVVNNGSGYVVLESSGTINLNGVTIDTSGNINCPATVTATEDVLGGGKSLKSHTHTISSGSSAGETLPPT